MKEQVRIGLSKPSRTPLLTMALMLAAALETSKQPESLHGNRAERRRNQKGKSK